MFANDLKPVFLTLIPTAPPLVWPEIKKTADLYNKEYGVDYAFLGYKDGKELVIKNIGQNIPQQFPQDYRGNPISSLKLMQGLKQAKDFPMLIAISSGFPGINEYVLQIQGLYNLPMIGACTAVSGPDYIPFFQVQAAAWTQYGNSWFRKIRTLGPRKRQCTIVFIFWSTKPKRFESQPHIHHFADHCWEFVVFPHPRHGGRRWIRLASMNWLGSGFPYF